MAPCQRHVFIAALAVITSNVAVEAFSVGQIHTKIRKPVSLSVFKTKKETTSAQTKNSKSSLVEESETVSPMPDLVSWLQRKEDKSPQMANEIDVAENTIDPSTLLYGAAALFSLTSVAIGHSLGLAPSDVIDFGQRLLASPQDTLQDVIQYVQSMGPLGPLYFGIIYLVAEILAVPATPLTLSAGYLFGLTKGTAVVLLAATIAASVGFFIGKTFLRTFVEGLLEEKPELAKIDRAIGTEGFRLLLLVRLSPIFPFALSNYVYGASSIDFTSYFFGTLLGFTPGTIAYVYTGMVGQALTLGEGAQPWYVYAGGFAILLGFLKLVSDVASDIVNAIED